jgi:tRNA threonylcarbamoyladenosine biosynthesis protein TsaE
MARTSPLDPDRRVRQDDRSAIISPSIWVATLEGAIMAPPRRPALDVISHSPEQTRRIGMLLGRALGRGSLVLLGGMIGAGKTTFAQGIARGLRVDTDVLSPTFTLVTEHAGLDASDQPVPVYHVDLYRIEDEDDLMSFGFEEYLADMDAITIVEWPERAGMVLPPEHMLIELSTVADSKRSIAFEPRDARYLPAIEGLRREMAGARG